MALAYRAVIFDLDGTLVSEEHGVEQATAAVAEALSSQGYAVSGEALNAARIAVVREAMAENRGTWPSWLTRVEWMRRAFVVVDVPAELAPDLAPVYLEGRLAGLTLIGDALQLLDALRPHVPTTLITNGDSAEQRLKLDRVGLNDYFPQPVISAEFGAQKPAAEIFLHTVGTLGVRPSEAIYIGNSYGNDVEGAAGAGLDSIWFNERGSAAPVDATLHPDHTCAHLRSVGAALGIEFPD
ncbi:MAG TPA: HAD family hydrolase [Dehalococcoidia bacterium]|nr:HAD family hydrolase [Dehalococcoidia bacterium]